MPVLAATTRTRPPAPATIRVPAPSMEMSPRPSPALRAGPPSPESAGLLLQEVCLISPADAWSAGSYSSGSPLGKILIERWNGRTWTQPPAGP